ncbi:MAG: G8 domain-containing protein, partial [Acidobacteriota bacterium]
MIAITVFLLLIFTGAGPALAQVLTPPGAFTHTAALNGDWASSMTWNGSAPADDAIVRVPQHTTVVLSTQEAARIDYLQVEGTLEIAGTSDTQLMVGTLYVTSTGALLTSGSVAVGNRAEIIFINDGSPIDRTWDPEERSRGLISQGVVQIYGAAKTHVAQLAGDAHAGATSLSLLGVPADWAAGDEIVVAGTQFQRNMPLEDETVTIQSVSGSTIYLNETLQYSHLHADPEMKIHVANLTRNVVFRSESTGIPLRGHLMFLQPNVDIRYASFIDLGRTDKSIPLDEILVDTETGAVSPNPNIQNRRGRYPIHFHLNGTLPGQDPPSKIYGCVVRRTPGWGFVNHSSHVDFQENVCHDFAGAGFVTEAGDELGNFFDNIAVRGTGVPGVYFPKRQVFRSEERPQPLSDFAFGGDGFWFQGPALRVKNNVASSCSGTGMFWFTTGAVDISNNKYVGFPTADINTVYSGHPALSNLAVRTWNYGSQPAVLSDLPILEMDNFDGYACLAGFRVRFNNSFNNAFYYESPYPYGNDFVAYNWEDIFRLGQSISNLRLWNNEQGFKVRYSDKTDWSDVKVANRLRFDDEHNPYVGAEMRHAIQFQKFTDLSISGYALAGWVVGPRDIDNSSRVEFVGQDYSNYANFDTLTELGTCESITGVSAFKTSTSSATVNWQPHEDAERF